MSKYNNLRVNYIEYKVKFFNLTATFTLIVPNSSSLKEKRIILNKFKDFFKKNNFSVYIYPNNNWNFSKVAISIIGNNESTLINFTNNLLDKIFEKINDNFEIKDIDWQVFEI